ncbi:protocadherin Fat 2 [Xenopus laevis]|uniref:Protocadherin Fat 2 n=2 Tax=Xenopus laevis TaxID=8355 RepID=A0A1L8GWK1_XENLA|nr:protocadherin Fat 2 [Xenopus laevis]OCT88214.1 hypothetical protein XELAEV_18016840mg [Xenopus laevis]
MHTIMGFTSRGILLLVILLHYYSACQESPRNEDPPPFNFTQSLYYATIYENSAPKTYVASKVKMGIYLKNIQSSIKYRIVSGDATGLFKTEDVVVGDFCFLRIRIRSGNSALLNREDKDNYQLIVHASGKSLLYEARVKVIIQVLDTNDLKPLLSKSAYQFKVTEDAALKKFVGKISATDADIGQNAMFFYTFSTKTPFFCIHPISGIVMLTGRLNATEKSRHSLQILVVDRMKKISFGDGFGNVASLEVLVEPAVKKTPFIASVTTKMPDLADRLLYATVIMDQAHSECSIDSLEIVAGDPLNYFKVVRSHVGKNEFTIVSTAQINWIQNQQGFNLSLQAKDKSKPPIYSPVETIHIPPWRFGLARFKQELYKVQISECAPPGSHVTLLKIIPAIPTVDYHFKAPTDKFKIFSKTGLIVTNSHMDVKDQSQFQLEVIALNGKISSTVIVDLIDCNNHAPVFTKSSCHGTFNENIPVGSRILQVTATDADLGNNGNITYTLASPKGTPFEINQFTGVITNNRMLDYELTQRWYRLRVWASDWGSPFRQQSEVFISLILNNLNDNSPMFEQVNCNVHIPRDISIGEKVVALSAVDIDELQNIQYEILSGNEQHKFKIDPTSGIITVGGAFYGLSDLHSSNFSLIVTANDGENYALPTVVNITISSEALPVSVKCEDTGVVNKIAATIIDSLDRHSQDQSQEEDTPFNIYLINSCTPQFNDDFPLSIDVAEDTPINSFIIQLSASDTDTGLNGHLVYVISEGNDDGCFVLDMETGKLMVSSSLDRERTSSYILNATVYDLGVPQKSSWKILAVNLLDANDNAPIFPKSGYCVAIPEDAKIGTSILKVRADDLDIEDNGKVIYSLLTPTEKFGIDSQTGEITVKGTLDRETFTSYTLKIEAKDQPTKGRQLFSVTDVVVSLEDVNDNTPLCRPVTANVKTPEDIPLGTTLYFVEALDMDVGSNGEVSYSLINDENGIFQVDKLTGALTLQKKLDFEKRSFYNLTVRATDAGYPFSHSSVCHVELEVLDVNENIHTPYIQSFVFLGSVQENSPPGTQVLSITATDEDKGKDGEIQYSIRDGSDISIFSINEETGAIRTEAPLDRESVSHYWLTVYATDLGSIPLTSVAEVYIEVTDINDNIPQLSQAVFYASITENSQPDVSVLQLDAFDSDFVSAGKISFQFSNGNSQGFFALNPSTGLISTTAKQLDRENKEEHILEVTVSDNGVPLLQSTSRVVIEVLDVNDNPPMFPQKLFTVQLPERPLLSDPAPVYRLVAMDRDKGVNAKVTYSIIENSGDMFTIQPSTGVISSKGPFPAGEYTILTVKAADCGSPARSSTVRLHIEWIPKPDPLEEPLAFEEPHYSFQVMETDPVNHMVGLIGTESINNQVWFQIIGGDDDLDFDIDMTTGGLAIAQPLHASKKSNYILTVEVTDGSNSVSTQVFIDLVPYNRHLPEFLESHYEVQVSEDVPFGDEIAKITATDKDSGNKLIFTIQSSADPRSSKMFRLDPNSGTLFTTEALDYETIPIHILTVMVRDQEIPIKRNFVRVTIQVQDSNDHPPRFIRFMYEVSLLNSAPITTEVVQARATDLDQGINAIIRYSILSGNTEGYFAIDPTSGVISVAKALEHPSKNHFIMTVVAIDQGTPQFQDTTTVNIYVKPSDASPPRFVSAEYVVEMSELMPIGSFVAMVSATSWSSINYEIRDGNTGGAFYINCYSGIISTMMKLDFETTSSYQLKVRGNSSLGFYSENTVFIYIIDENDNAPVFSQVMYTGQISEDAVVGSMVTNIDLTPLIIQAYDNDTESNALLTYQILDPEVLKYFQIEPNMGTIFTTAELDYELTKEFNFIVHVHDGGLPSFYASTPAKVTIQVYDVNDSPPRLIRDTYELNLYLPAYQSMEILHVEAKDDDSMVTYSISEGNEDNAFFVEQSTGLLTLNDPSLLNAYCELTVKVSDGLYYDTTLVKINVTDIQDSSLKFDQNYNKARVLENDAQVQVLTVLDVVGIHLHEPLYFSVLTYTNYFQISKSSGVLQTKGLGFDREVQEKFDVVIEVRDNRNPPRVSQTMVKVKVEDVNDNPPEFINTPYYIIVQDGLEPGDVIFQVTSIDKDSGRNSELTYWLAEEYKYFRIDPNLGDIIWKQPFDFEALSQYTVTVGVIDHGQPPFQAEEEVIIILRNKSHPIFQSLYYKVTVPENILVNTPILHIQARSPEGFRVIYNIVENEVLVLFNIDFKTGALSIASPLDYETKTKYKFTVRATDTTLGLYSESRVSVEVEDVNDHAPVFSKLVYLSHVMEKLPPHRPFIQVVATDKDSGQNQQVSYHILGNNTDDALEFFHIDSKTGEITTAQKLDYELRHQFQFRVRAIDNGNPPLHADAVVIVNVSDVNDNPPEFTQQQYEANVSELANCGHIIIKVQALDQDSIDTGKLEYLIQSGNNHRHFTINRTSGVISRSNLCKNSLNLSYHLLVSVSDGVFRASVPVYINVNHANKYSPSFQQDMYEVELAENKDAGTGVIEVVAVDSDDGPYGIVQYTIINKLASEKFSIDSDGHIATLAKLDRENSTERVIAIKIMAKDGGGRAAFCTVKIILTDENDNPPQFKAMEYTLSVQSNLNKGTPVIKVVAFDVDEGLNADVTYSLNTSDEDLFQIDPTSGVITAKESLLKLENQAISFIVIAKDGAIPHWSSGVPVYLQIVPKEVPLPRFSEPLYSFSASEDLPMGSEVGLVKALAVEPIIYSLVEGTTTESNKDWVFSMNKHTGALIMKKGVDHEKTKWYLIDVQANCTHQGKELISLVPVSIQVKDINDNQPVFEADLYRASMTENMPSGSTVIQVTANDQDTGSDGMVTYSLKADSAEIQQIFTIDSDKGWITTLKELDCEKQDVYRFYVVASDQGSKIQLSSEVLVEVTVTDDNDNPPYFTSQNYKGSVTENSEPGQVITTFKIWDKDISESNRKVTCYITDGDPSGLFSIDKAGDQWVIKTKKPLDREKEEKHLLQVTASDGKFQATVGIEIIVLDINDNSPECLQMIYTATVSEDAPPGLFITKISAKDSDAENNAQLSYALYGLGDNLFRLDPNTGELTSLAPLDREQRSSYKLVAKATDGGGLSCQVDVMLSLQDVNDNSPVFSMIHYSVTVFDNTTVKTPIVVVSARDPDEGLNAEVLYSLLNSANGLFLIEEATGIIHLERPLDDMEDTVIDLKACASDRGFPYPLSTCTDITVFVASLSRSVFGSPEKIINVAEDKAVGSELLSLSDLTHSREEIIGIKYEILNGNEKGIFRLATDTGSLYLNNNLDFETDHQYYLSIEATSDDYPPLSDVTVVIINVSDVNDHEPIFSKEDYVAEIREDAVVGDFVLAVPAFDRDGPQNNKITYAIMKGDPLGHFSIHPECGEIRVLSVLDREQMSTYPLVIRAIDNGRPAHFNEVLARVYLSDVNDNPPIFSQSSYSLVIRDGASITTTLVKLIVTDNDSPKNGPPFHFRIIGGNEGNVFKISPDGVLSNIAVPKRVTKEKYLLEIQVTDNGIPHLSSSTFVSIQVIDQSHYCPVVLPLEILITTSETVFHGSVLGKLHATDQDPHDTLMYSLAAEEIKKGQFSVGHADGKIMALESLLQGHYNFNVTVSDGTFSTSAPVHINVWCFTKETLKLSLVLRFKDLSPEEFIGDHWRSLQRFIGNLLKVDRQQIHMASLQKYEEASYLDLLLLAGVGQSSATNPLILAEKITRSAHDLSQALGLQVEKMFHLPCQNLQCQNRTCQELIYLDPTVLSSYSTARLSVITPRHTLQQDCTCNGQAVKFDRSSFVQHISEFGWNWKIEFGLKTHQSDSVLVFANGSTTFELKMHNGALHFKQQCVDNVMQELVSEVTLNDGYWHNVLLEVTGPFVLFRLDDNDNRQSIKPCPTQSSLLNLFIGGVIQESGYVSNGFQGCLDDISINGQTLSSLGQPVSKKGIVPCCEKHGACTNEPCPADKICAELPNGGYACLSHSLFNDQGTDPCKPSHCLHSRVCAPISNGYTCSCPPGHTGVRCESETNGCLDPSCQANDRCNHSSACNCTDATQGGHCTESVTPATNSRYVLVSGPQEIVEIFGGLLAVLFLVGLFVVFRKRICQRNESQKPAPQEDPDLKHHLSRDLGVGSPMTLMELSILSPSGRTQLDAEGQTRPQPIPELLTFCKPQGGREPAVCSVAPNLPPAPPSSSDNESIAKNHWDCEDSSTGDNPYWPHSYSPADGQGFKTYDSLQNTYALPQRSSAPPVPPLPKGTKSENLYGGFPFPLESSNKRAPIPACYSNSTLDDFLPQPPHCLDQYTAISYYPSQLLKSEGLSHKSDDGYRRLSVRLSVAQPSYANCSPPPMPPLNYQAANMAESDYGSSEEVMF